MSIEQIIDSVSAESLEVTKGVVKQAFEFYQIDSHMIMIAFD